MLQISFKIRVGGCRPHSLSLQTAEVLLFWGQQRGIITSREQKGVITMGHKGVLLCGLTKEGTVTVRHNRDITLWGTKGQ